MQPNVRPGPAPNSSEPSNTLQAGCRARTYLCNTACFQMQARPANSSEEAQRTGGKAKLAADLATLGARSHLHTAWCRGIAIVPWSHFLLEISCGGAHLQEARAAVRVSWKEEGQIFEGWGGALVFWVPRAHRCLVTTPLNEMH